MIHSVIMAGGEGQRLRPLTCDIPKPLLPLCGRPVLEYCLDLLAGHGIKKASVTLGYLGQRVEEHFSDGHRRDIGLSFVEEDRPLGTAGGVKNACPALLEGELLVVLSGDALCDFNLTAALELHRQKGADATLLLKRVEDPREYGLVCLDGEGMVTGFVEKPSYYQAVSEYANTGIYILSPAALELIPGRRAFDFASDLFPLMLERGMGLAGAADDGYWCDMGDPDSYLRCQKDLLNGRVNCRVPGRRDRQGNLLRSSKPRGSYTLEAPVYIGAGVKIGEGAVIEAGSILCDRARVEAGARISGSLLGPGSSVGRRCTLTDAILAPGATLRDRAMAFEGSVLGTGARLGQGSVAAPRARLWPGMDVPDYAHADGAIKRSPGGRGWFDDDGINDGGCARLSPELCARVGAALGAMGGGRLGLGCAEDEAARLYKDALALGARSAGAKVLDFGAGSRAQYNFAMELTGAVLGAYITGGSAISIQVTGEAGLPAHRAEERKLEALLSLGESPAAHPGEVGEQVEIAGVWELYCSHVAKHAPQGLEGVSCTVKCGDVQMERQAREVLAGLGCNMLGGFTLWLDRRGERVTLFEEEQNIVPYHRLLAAVCDDVFSQGNDVALSYDAPRAIDKLAAARGQRVLRYYSCPADHSDDEARALAATQFWTRDALMLTVRLLELARRKGGVTGVLSGIPGLFVTERTARIEGSPAAVISRLSMPKENAGEGTVVARDNAAALVRPGKNGRLIRIIAEAPTSEVASELCADLLRRLGLD